MLLLGSVSAWLALQPQQLVDVGMLQVAGVNVKYNESVLHYFTALQSAVV